MKLVLLVAVAGVLCGCLTHEASATVRTEQPIRTGRAVIETTEHRLPPSPPTALRRSPLPRDLPVSVWALTDDGEDGYLVRAEARVLSPLPWWQYFPLDLPLDMIPVEWTVATAAVIVPTRVEERTLAQLVEEAREHGYAH